MVNLFTCWKCMEEIPEITVIERNTICPSCISSQRCCKNCEFYDQFSHNDCREPVAEWVEDKERGNFCDYFKQRKKHSSPTIKQVSKKDAEKRWQELKQNKKK